MRQTLSKRLQSTPAGGFVHGEKTKAAATIEMRKLDEAELGCVVLVHNLEVEHIDVGRILVLVKSEIKILKSGKAVSLLVNFSFESLRDGDTLKEQLCVVYFCHGEPCVGILLELMAMEQEEGQKGSTQHAVCVRTWGGDENGGGGLRNFTQPVDIDILRYTCEYTMLEDPVMTVAIHIPNVIRTTCRQFHAWGTHAIKRAGNLMEGQAYRMMSAGPSAALQILHS